MTTTPDLTPNDLSHLSDEESLALSPQGEHAPGPEPLSSAAQAVLDAVSDKYTTFVFIEYDDKNPFALKNPVSKIAAAAICALADQVVPEQGCPIYGLTERENERQQVRSRLLAIATELEGTND